MLLSNDPVRILQHTSDRQVTFTLYHPAYTKTSLLSLSLCMLLSNNHVRIMCHMSDSTFFVTPNITQKQVSLSMLVSESVSDSGSEEGVLLLLGGGGRRHSWIRGGCSAAAGWGREETLMDQRGVFCCCWLGREEMLVYQAGVLLLLGRGGKRCSLIRGGCSAVVGWKREEKLMKSGFSCLLLYSSCTNDK